MQRRLLPYLASVAAGSTAYIAAFTAAALLAEQITGSRTLSGIPSAVGVVGSAVGAGFLSAYMSRRGRRSGLLLGYGIALAGGIGAVLSVVLASFALLLVATLLLGVGNAALGLTRYAASDTVSPERRAAAIGTVIWGSTVGAVLGPNLLQPAGWLAGIVGRTQLEGAFGIVVAGFVVALAIVAFGLPRRPMATPADQAAALGTSRRGLLAHPRVRVALIGLLSSQVVMVLIMAMTPVHIHDAGHDLATVGIVISAHTLGMFGLSPLSGRLVSRLGAVIVLYAGFGTLLVAALLGAIAPNDGVPLLTLALFLLGFGWNLAFVAGSSLLTRGASLADRIRLQGLTDALVWTVAAAASIVSGPLLELAGFAALALFEGALLALPVVAVGLLRRRLTGETSESELAA